MRQMTIVKRAGGRTVRDLRYQGVLMAVLLVAGAMVAPAAGAVTPDFEVVLTEGDVFLQRADDVEWGLALPADQVRAGDRLWAGPTGRLEVNSGSGLVVRLDHQTQVELIEESPRQSLVLLTGALYVKHPDLWRENLEVEITAGVARLSSGEATVMRVEEYGDGTVGLRVYKGTVTVTTDTEQARVRSGQQTEITPDGLIERPQRIALAQRDEFDAWNDELELQLARGAPSRSDEADYSQLGGYGTWVTVPVYGRVWQPWVSVEWRPYYYGQWLWVTPYGWTWVSADPWGYIPHHYGQWVRVSSYGWVWLPGTQWAPAWVIWTPYQYGWAWAPYGPTVVSLHLSSYLHYWSWTIHLGDSGWHHHHHATSTPKPRHLHAVNGPTSPRQVHPPRPQQHHRGDAGRRIPLSPEHRRNDPGSRVATSHERSRMERQTNDRGRPAVEDASARRTRGTFSRVSSGDTKSARSTTADLGRRLNVAAERDAAVSRQPQQRFDSTESMSQRRVEPRSSVDRLPRSIRPASKVSTSLSGSDRVRSVMRFPSAARSSRSFAQTPQPRSSGPVSYAPDVRVGKSASPRSAPHPTSRLTARTKAASRQSAVVTPKKSVKGSASQRQPLVRGQGNPGPQ